MANALGSFAICMINNCLKKGGTTNIQIVFVTTLVKILAAIGFNIY